MYKLSFIPLLLLSLLSRAQIHADPEEAFKLSRQSGRPVLLVFSGSDWCVPCMQFEKHILQDTAFVSYASGHLVVLKADFPQKKKNPAELTKAYELLADQYNPKGDFPCVLLLDSDKRELGTLLFLDQEPSEFIKQIEQKMLR